MSVTKYCDTLRKHHVADNNTGTTFDPQTDEVKIKSEKVVSYCLNCNYFECQAKIKDDQRADKDDN